MATPIRLPLSQRQAAALVTLLEYWPVGHRVEPLDDPEAIQALREVAEKLNALREG